MQSQYNSCEGHGWNVSDHCAPHPTGLRYVLGDALAFRHNELPTTRDRGRPWDLASAAAHSIPRHGLGSAQAGVDERRRDDTLKALLSEGDSAVLWRGSCRGRSDFSATPRSCESSPRPLPARHPSGGRSPTWWASSSPKCFRSITQGSSPSDRLHSAFNDWMETRGQRPLSRSAFQARWKESASTRGFTKAIRVDPVTQHRFQQFRGVRMNWIRLRLRSTDMTVCPSRCQRVRCQADISLSNQSRHDPDDGPVDADCCRTSEDRGL